MYKLLNRFAWLISIAFGYLITFFIFLGFDALDSRWFWDDDMVWFWLILTFIIGAIFKGIFLSENRITEAFENMINKIKISGLKQDNRRTNSNNEVINDNVEGDYKNVCHSCESRNLPNTELNRKILNQVQDDNQIDKKEKNKAKLERFRQKFKSSPKNLSFPEIETASSDNLLNQSSAISSKSSAISGAIKNFFAENLMAKVGGILLFLGVLFLLQLAYSYVGNVGKIILGFVIGFVTIGVGVFLDKKKLTNESRIVLGIGFLINFLVILSGRYLLGDSSNPFLSEGLTFVLLVLNTVFAIVTSLVYKSNNLLIFSFIFAYLNPFLVGGKAEHPYTLSIYSLVVSAGALFLSNYFKKENISNTLLLGAFVLGNLLFLVAPFFDSFEWIVKLVFMVVLSLITFFLAYKQDKKKLLAIFVALAYMFVLLLTVYGSFSISHMFESTFALIGLLAGLTIFTVLSVFSILISGIQIALFLFIAPLLIISVLLLSGNFLLAPYALAYILLLFVFGFAFIAGKTVGIIKYILWAMFAILFSILSGAFNFINIGTTQGIILMLSMLVFLGASYFLSTKKDLQILYAIGSIFSAFMLSALIQTKGDLLSISIFATAFYAIANISLPLLSKNLIKGKTTNLALGVVAGLIFVAFTVYRFGNEYFPGLALGFAFLTLAMLYFIVSYLMYMKFKPELENKETKIQAQNSIFAILAGTISLLSIAVSYIFSKHGEFIATTWLLEGVTLLYFFGKTQNKNIYIGAMILFIISVFKLQDSLDMIHHGDYISLIPLLIIIAITAISAKFMEKSYKIEEIFYNIVHIIVIFATGVAISNIFIFHHHGFGILAGSLLTALLFVYYSKLNLKYLIHIFSGVFVFVLIMHIANIEKIFYYLTIDNLTQYKVIQYIIPAILGGSLYLTNKSKKVHYSIWAIFALYLLYITSYFVYDLFHNTFAVTIYWAIVSAILLINGINKDIIKFRTIGLYLLILTVGKIVLYDIWYNIDTAVVRVLALMIVGALMIFISTLYSKKYNGDLKGELDISNLKGDNTK